MEGDYFLHPLFTRGWTVGMDIHSLGHFRVRFTGHHPPAAGEKNLVRDTGRGQEEAGRGSRAHGTPSVQHKLLVFSMSGTVFKESQL